MVQGRLQSVTIAANDPERVADFYAAVFGMRVLERRPAQGDDPGAVYMTDGHTCFGILQAGVHVETFRPEGLHDIGFLVDDMEEVEARAAEWGALRPLQRRDSAYAERRFGQASLA